MPAAQPEPDRIQQLEKQVAELTAVVNALITKTEQTDNALLTLLPLFELKKPIAGSVELGEKVRPKFPNFAKK